MALTDSYQRQEDRNEQKNETRTDNRVQTGDTVLIKNTVRNQFQPSYGPETMTVTDTENHGTGAILTRENGKTMRRHVDDIKTLPTDVNDQNVEVDTENETDMTPPLADNTAPLKKYMKRLEDLSVIVNQTPNIRIMYIKSPFLRWSHAASLTDPLTTVKW